MVDAYNNLYHSSIKTTPQKLYDEDETILLEARTSEQKEHRLDVIKKRGNAINNSGSPLLVGDTVRIKIKKNDLDKKSIDNWSDAVYTIYKVSKPKNESLREKYKLQNDENNIIRDSFHKNQLQKVDIA